MPLFLERQCGRTPGIAYAVVGGCPLTILGGTGPVLIFTELLYKFCHSIDVDFLPFYAWTGVWIGVMSIILAAFDVAVVIKRVTRFTDEIFAGLISLIFTLSAILDLVKVWPWVLGEVIFVPPRLFVLYGKSLTCIVRCMGV